MLLKAATFVLILSFCVIANAGTNERFNLRTDDFSESPSEGWGLVFTKLGNLLMDVLKKSSPKYKGHKRQIMKLKASTYVTARALSPEQLIQMASSKGSPFIEDSLRELNGKMWGTRRALRSTDCVIFNNSDKEFTLVENGCDSGGWANDLLPNHKIPAHSSVVHGTWSNRFMTGATGCRVLYRSSDGATIEMSVSNPFAGDNHAYSKGSGVSAAEPVVSSGDNNQVRFDIGSLSLRKVVPYIEVYTPKDKKLATTEASSLSNSLGSGLSAQQLMDMAKSFNSPFMPDSLERFKKGILGRERAMRSTDCVIFNDSDQDFILIQSGCDSGQFTNGLTPSQVLPAHSSVVYGTESNGFMTGATCSVTYRSSEGSTFELSTSNPYAGDNHASLKTTAGASFAQPVLTAGKHNQVHLHIDPMNLRKPYIEVYTPKEKNLAPVEASAYGKSGTALPVGQLIDLALSKRARFTEDSLEKLQGDKFGHKRGKSSTDVVIFNDSDKNFTLVSQGCLSGKFTEGLKPNQLIPARSSVVYGTQSTGFMMGATGCRVLYRSSDGATVEMSVSNPFVGNNHAYSKGSGISAPEPVVTGGKNNQVRFNIDPLKSRLSFN